MFQENKMGNTYEQDLKKAAEILTSQANKGDTGKTLWAKIKPSLECSDIEITQIINDLANLGVIIALHNDGYEIAISKNELDKVWDSYLFKRLISIRKKEIELGIIDVDKSINFFRTFSPDNQDSRKAVEVCVKAKKFSTALIMSHIGKGHAWTNALANWLEQIGVVSPLDDKLHRKLLITSMEEFDKKAAEALT